MPKRPRQAHIPTSLRRRKVRREPGSSSGETVSNRYEVDLTPEDALLEEATAGAVTAPAASRPLAPRTGRRMEQLSRTREDISGVRNIPGALPVLGRAYLAEELRRIALTSGSLLALIIVLWLVLR